MAIDPRIALLTKTPSASSAINIFENALMNAQTRDIRGAQESRAAAQAPTSQEIGSARNIQRLNSAAQFSQFALPGLAQGDIEGTRQQLLQRRQELINAAGQGADVDTNETDEALQLLDTNPALLAQRMQQSIDASRAIQHGGASSAGQRQFESLIKGFSPEEQEEARRISAGLAPRAVSSAAATIATTPGLTDIVAGSEATIAGEKAAKTEGAKLTQQLRFKPAIQSAVKLAEEEARSRGETLSTLGRSRAAMPGLINVVDSLKELAPIATSTLGGRVFNTVVKEAGFGATKGSTARAKFIAIVSNQVLPLLKETFGAAFTANEGQELKATMGDPNASPDEKIAQLEVFIEQKQRSIETAERELNQPAAVPVAVPVPVAEPAQQGVTASPSGRTDGQLMTDAQGNKAFVFPDGTFEETQ